MQIVWPETLESLPPDGSQGDPEEGILSAETEGDAMNRFRRGDAETKIVVTVLLFVVAAILIAILVAVWKHGYRNGQIDALTGVVAFERIVMESNGRTGWVEKIEGPRESKELKVYRIGEGDSQR